MLKSWLKHFILSPLSTYRIIRTVSSTLWSNTHPCATDVSCLSHFIFASFTSIQSLALHLKHKITTHVNWRYYDWQICAENTRKDDTGTGQKKKTPTGLLVSVTDNTCRSHLMISTCSLISPFVPISLSALTVPCILYPSTPHLFCSQHGACL